jgi:hypothetical protein
MRDPWDWYYDEFYTDAELVTNTRAGIGAVDWAACTGACMASLVYTYLGVFDEAYQCFITDLEYTITAGADGGTCYWTVRFTDSTGAVTDTAMSGSGTYTIEPTVPGTWEIINLSGNAPS